MELGAGALFPLQAAAAGAGIVAADLDHPHGLALGGTLYAGGTVAGHKALTGGLGNLLPLGGGTGLPDNSLYQSQFGCEMLSFSDSKRFLFALYLRSA